VGGVDNPLIVQVKQQQQPSTTTTDNSCADKNTLNYRNANGKVFRYPFVATL